ncbi:MAG TPA: GNAT family N-acetyltransferase, partial [Geobacteraceae bacterium]|nr:GNAT family N-acetyltransferase [Geobacteraceae bacterium]
RTDMKTALTYSATTDYPAHREGMLDLYQRSYGKENHAFYDSFYAGNPLGEPFLFLCHDGNTLVGQENYLRQMVSCDGRLLSAGLGVNTLVDSRYRLLHGVFGRLCALSLESLAGELDMLCAFANEESKKYYLKNYGWQVVAKVRVYKKATRFSGLRAESLLSLLRPGGRRIGLRLVRTDEFDPSLLDPVIERCRAGSRYICFHKTAAFLNWKFLRNTHYLIHGYYIMSGDRISGYCLTYDSGIERRVIDLRIEGNDHGLMDKTVATLSSMTREDGLSRLVIHAVPGCWYEKTLKRRFFIRRWEYDCIARPVREELPSGDWVIQLGDFDMF